MSTKCPNCGYCPSCGRANPQAPVTPYYPPPYYPWWQSPTTPYFTITASGDTITGTSGTTGATFTIN